jgi:hypothetical protein
VKASAAGAGIDVDQDAVEAGGIPDFPCRTMSLRQRDRRELRSMIVKRRVIF